MPLPPAGLGASRPEDIYSKLGSLTGDIFDAANYQAGAGHGMDPPPDAEVEFGGNPAGTSSNTVDNPTRDFAGERAGKIQSRLAGFGLGGGTGGGKWKSLMKKHRLSLTLHPDAETSLPDSGQAVEGDADTGNTDNTATQPTDPLGGGGEPCAGQPGGANGPNGATAAPSSSSAKSPTDRAPFANLKLGGGDGSGAVANVKLGGGGGGGSGGAGATLSTPASGPPGPSDAGNSGGAAAPSAGAPGPVSARGPAGGEGVRSGGSAPTGPAPPAQQGADSAFPMGMSDTEESQFLAKEKQQKGADALAKLFKGGGGGGGTGIVGQMKLLASQAKLQNLESKLEKAESQVEYLTSRAEELRLQYADEKEKTSHLMSLLVKEGISESKRYCDQKPSSPQGRARNAADEKKAFAEKTKQEMQSRMQAKELDKQKQAVENLTGCIRDHILDSSNVKSDLQASVQWMRNEVYRLQAMIREFFPTFLSSLETIRQNEVARGLVRGPTCAAQASQCEIITPQMLEEKDGRILDLQGEASALRLQTAELRSELKTVEEKAESQRIEAESQRVESEKEKEALRDQAKREKLKNAAPPVKEIVKQALTLPELLENVESDAKKLKRRSEIHGLLNNLRDIQNNLASENGIVFDLPRIPSPRKTQSPERGQRPHNPLAMGGGMAIVPRLQRGPAKIPDVVLRMEEMEKERVVRWNAKVVEFRKQRADHLEKLVHVLQQEYYELATHPPSSRAPEDVAMIARLSVHIGEAARQLEEHRSEDLAMLRSATTTPQTAPSMQQQGCGSGRRALGLIDAAPFQVTRIAEQPQPRRGSIVAHKYGGGGGGGSGIPLLPSAFVSSGGGEDPSGAGGSRKDSNGKRAQSGIYVTTSSIGRGKGR